MAGTMTPFIEHLTEISSEPQEEECNGVLYHQCDSRDEHYISETDVKKEDSRNRKIYFGQ